MHKFISPFETYLLIKVGNQIGALLTIALLVVTAALGGSPWTYLANTLLKCLLESMGHYQQGEIQLSGRQIQEEIQ